MQGWQIPPPKIPSKSSQDFERERIEKVGWLVGQGYLKSRRIEQALLKVPREEFIPYYYRDYAYLEVPLPLPGEHATISCPHSYPLFYEPLGLDKGHRFLEIGSGSGYGAAVAREVVGRNGLVVSVEIDEVTLEFAKRNLEKAGYRDVLLVRANGGFGYPEMSPYDSVAVTAACAQFPPALIEQLRVGGRLIGPLFEDDAQSLVLLQKNAEGVERRALCKVLYISLRGACGVE